MTRPDWDSVLDLMIAELKAGGPRAEAYWAQQLAFGPVLVHALGLRLWRSPPSKEHAGLLVPSARLAFAALGSLPEASSCDQTSLRLLAARQARAIGWRRRATLANVLVRLGEQAPTAVGEAPSRMARAYPLIGFRPGERLAG
jgi:hypothetical protein